VFSSIAATTVIWYTTPAMDLLVVEDDAKVRAALSKGFSEAGYEVTAVPSAESALQRLKNDRPRLIVLDLGLPGRDGYAVLSAVRERYGELPVVILTARDSVSDRVTGLDAGADDYLVKPFAFPELLARVRVHLRARDASVAIHVGDLVVDPVAHLAHCGDGAMDLTPLEFSLLHCLAANANTIVTREMLASEVWRVTSRATPIDNIIHVHVSHLRSKIGEYGSSAVIRTVRGLGYTLEAS